MSDWFYPLMLLVILAGYVFLFLQGRAVMSLQRELGHRIQKMEHSSPAALEVREVAAAKAMTAEEGEDLRQSLDAQGAVLRELRAMVEANQQILLGAAVRPEGQVPTPEEVARRFLLEEGFARIHMEEAEPREDGVRLLVRAVRGDQMRSGHVVVAGDRVVEASLKVPTALFP